MSRRSKANAGMQCFLSKAKSLRHPYAVFMRYLVIENTFNAYTNFRLDTVTHSLYTR